MRRCFALRRPPTLSALLLLAAAGCASGLYADGGPVATLSSSDVVSGVVTQDRTALWVVEFTVADGCPPCKAFEPQFSLAAEKLRGLAKFGSVDCSASANKAFCAGAGLRSLPAVRLHPWEARRNPYKPRDGLIKFPTDIAGELTARALSDAVTSALPYDFVLNVSSVQPDWRAQLSGEPPLAVLFTEKAGATPLYRALSLRFRQRLRLALARANDAELAAAFGVTAAPTLVLRLGDELVRYDGELKAAALAEFLEQHAAPAPAPAEDKPQSEPAAGWQPLALHNASHFASAILGSEKAALVAFVGGDACVAERDAWRAVARPHDGQVNVAEADAGAPWAARYLAAGRCLTVVRFAYGAEKGDPDAEAEADVYPADAPVEKGRLGAWALESVPDFVQFVTASTAQPYFSTAARLPKLVLVTDKAETPAMFRALAANFHGRVQFARTHIKDELAANMRVERAPAVRAMLVPPGAQPDPDGTLPLAIQEFFGALRYDQLAVFCEALAHAAGGGDDGEGPAVAKGADDVVELADSAALHSVCEARGGLCLVALLDSRAKAVQAQLAQLRASASRQRGTAPVHFCWVDVARYSSFAAAFDVTAAPTAVVLSAKKLRYAPLRIAFSTDAVTSLVDDVLAGRVSTVALSALPRLEAGAVAGGAAPVDEAPAEEVEEEFDLSDIMGVEVEDSSSREARLREAEQALKREAAERAAAEAQAQAEAEAARAAKAKKKKRKAKKQEL